jgi:ferredoxin/flavodoxin---NADP+ reductase
MANVFVVGAGPAGMFAAQKLAQAGHETIILNRDIKPGGLAEYGIYPLKDKMKIGLRKQFAKVLALPNVHYFGHVPVASNSPVTIDALREFCPGALVFAVGAQGTKKLGLPGEDLRGVYSAKDFVYYYNQLPPFATQDFSVGKRVAIVGMGNVMVDIARWLMVDSPERSVEEVIVIARRGPLEAKFDEKEFANIQIHLDRKAFQDELHRVEPAMKAVGQDIAKVAEETFPVLAKAPDQQTIPPRLTFRFLSSPSAIIGGPDGRIARLIVTENILVERDGGISAKATDRTAGIDVDTLIFAIGDQHDPSLGLPYAKGGYVTNPDVADPCANYQVFNHEAGQVCSGDFVLGWARKPSEGLVGIARHDGEVGAAHVLQFLANAQPRTGASTEDIARFLERKDLQFVPKADLRWLTAAEEKAARERGMAYYFFPDDESMLSQIEREKSTSAATAAPLI